MATPTFEEAQQALREAGVTGQRVQGVNPFEFLADRGRIESAQTSEQLAEVEQGLSESSRAMARPLLAEARQRLAGG